MRTQCRSIGPSNTALTVHTAERRPLACVMFEDHLRRWDLEPDGEPVVTPRTHLLPVTRAGRPAMLKIANHASGALGNAVLAWWAGEGAVPVLARDGAAVLLERAPDPATLLRLYEQGRDEEAIGIITRVAEELHAPRSQPPPDGIAP